MPGVPLLFQHGLVALMGLARPAGMRASPAPACLSRSRRSRVTDQAPASQRLSMGLRGICRGSFLRNAQAISLRAAQYHLLTVVEKEMFSRWILARGDFGAQRATRARPAGRRVSVLRQSRGGRPCHTGGGPNAGRRKVSVPGGQNKTTDGEQNAPVGLRT